MATPFVSVIVTTYNWPQALERVLSGLSEQTYQHLEVIVADDGSTKATQDCIHSWQQKSRFPIVHCWQPDDGFRAAMIRNRAAAMAKGEYLIFLDGDCVPLPHFVANHVKLAEKGWFVAGNRVLLSETFTKTVLQQQLNLERWSLKSWFWASLTRKCNRFLPLLYFPLGQFRKIGKSAWEGAKTCNLGVWREDFLAVNGLDEAFIGWGYEDSDLVVRLQKKHVFKKIGKYALGVLHLWHPNQDRSKADENRQRLQQTIDQPQTQAQKGVNQYLTYGDCNS
jgi:glycosyltransferase involved in cell wall biosynthesis